MITYIEIFKNDLKFIIPEMFLGISILIILICGVNLKNKFKHKSIITVQNFSWLGIQTLFITSLLILNSPYGYNSIFNNMMIIDGLTSFIKLIVLLSTIVVIIMCFEYFKFEWIYTYEYSILMLLSVFGMMLLVSSTDFLMIYLAIELQSLCMYVLATYKRSSEYSTEAGLKYFILGALSSGLLLFGSAAIYGLTGSTTFEAIYKLLVESPFNFNQTTISMSIAIIFIIAGLLFKIAVAPFHMWAPDVYQGAPLIITGFFAIVPKIAVLGLLIELFLGTFHELLYQWQPIFIICSLTSILIGTIGALGQTNIKRLLAYSSISHMGYVLIGLASANIEGIQGLLLYMIIYIIMSINIFTCFLSLYRKTNYRRIISIYELKGLPKENPMLAIIMSMTVLSMAGIPPLAGYGSKLYIFLAAIESSLYAVALIAVVSSVIGAVYYIRIVRTIYFDNINTYNIYHTMDIQKALILSITSLFILFFMACPSLLLIITHEIALNFAL